MVVSCVIKVLEKLLLFLVVMLNRELHINENIENESPLNHS